MNISKNALTVLERRYLKKDENGDNIETVGGMFRRVAKAIAEADLRFDPHGDTARTEDTFYRMMTEFEFLPNSPTLMNAGRPLGQLSACFVLPVGDSMEEIFEAVKQAALIHKSGGGTGFSFSRLRASGSAVQTTGGVASGPVSFMRVFNMATEAVKQGGTRRGANMGILRVDHPDILQFIDCKRDNSDITNFNISVGITEEFMAAVEENADYELINPNTQTVTGTLNARDVFFKMIDSAWRNGEPGIVFLDRLNRDNVIPKQGEIESTNPCGEQPLLPYESCNLGSINLLHMLKETSTGWELDESKLERTVKDAVHFLDNVIEINKYPIEKIGETTRLARKIGLGVMGYADMLLRLGIPYNSEQGVAFAESIMKRIHDTAWDASRELAKKRGPFPLFHESILMEQEPVRNGTVTTIAPTGTLSIIAGCSSGVEPVFAYVFIRNIMDNTEMIEVNQVLEDVLKKRGLYSDGLMRKIAKAGSLAHIEELPEDIRRVFVSSHDVSPEYHIRMQAAFQKYTDNAVSKTVNFKNEATREEVGEVFTLAYKLGCKGVTIYRDGSRDGQVLNIREVKKETEAEKEAGPPKPEIIPRARPETTYGITEKVKIGCGNLYVTVNYDEQGICEVFTSTGKAGGCPSQSEATARLASIALRAGISVETIIGQLRGIRCPSTIRRAGLKCTSCPDAIARIVEKVVDVQKKYGGKIPVYALSAIAQGVPEPEPACPAKPFPHDNQIRYCPECGALLEHESGCIACRSCGFSKCN